MAFMIPLRLLIIKNYVDTYFEDLIRRSSAFCTWMTISVDDGSLLMVRPASSPMGKRFLNSKGIW